MYVEDFRTDKEKETLTWGVIGTDSFMSGWGGAANGASYACWACGVGHIEQIKEWVSARPEMKRVRVVNLQRYRPDPNRCSHFSIYTARKGEHYDI